MQPEAAIERRRLRRKLTFWRVAAAVVAILAVVLAFPSNTKLAGGDRVARISVDGFISTNPDAADDLDRAAKDKGVKAILVRIDSPGGSAAGGEALYQAVRDAAAVKPVVAVIDGLGASAAYMTAIAADRVIARESAITGSIGVIFQYANATDFLDRLGISIDTVKSAPLKAEPSPFSKTDPRAVAMLRSVVDDTYEWFVGLVADRRKLDPATARNLADGRIVTGRQAAELGLVDEVGGEDEARAWLAAEKDISLDVRTVDWRNDDLVRFGLRTALVNGLLRWFDGGSGAFDSRVAEMVRRRFTFEGLLMMWQAPISPGGKVRGSYAAP